MNKIMGTYILSSMFPHGFNREVTEQFCKLIQKRDRFAFIASDFEENYKKTDEYFRLMLNMFHEKGIIFHEACVIDGRMPKEYAKRKVQEADVVWISGGDTIAEHTYLLKYGLDEVIRQHSGIVIGMSAGAINLSQTSICTVTCGHCEQKIYQGLGCVDISVEPHFVAENVTEELLELSKRYVIYGLCDGGIIVHRNGRTQFFGEVYRIKDGTVCRV